MSHDREASGLVNQFDSLLRRHLELGNPRGLALFQIALKSFVDAAAKFAFGERAGHMGTAGRATVCERKDVIDQEGNTQFVNAADHFADAFLADLLKFRQLREKSGVGSIEKVTEE